MRDENRFVRRLAIFTMVSFVAFAASANQEYVTGDGYWKPGSADFTAEASGKYLNPYGSRILIDTNRKNPESVSFAATPDKGWSVDHWRKSFTTSFSVRNAGTEISNTKGALAYVQGWESNDPVFIAVKFKHLSYDLKYDGNGATSPQGKSGVLYTNKIQLATAPAAPVGKSFRIWQDEKGNKFNPSAKVTGTSFTELDDIHVDGHIVTLKAIWTNNIYTITFNANGGSVTPASMTVTYGQPYGDLPTPTWTDHAFLGWFDGETKVTSTSTVTITANSELKAKWSLNTYTVSFGVTGDGQGTVSPTSATVASGQSVTVIATPAENSRFTGWTDGLTDATRQIVVKSNATYVANFEMKKYTVTFYWFCADGTPTNESQIVCWGEDAVEPQDIPIRTGYIRQGWEKSFTEVKSNLDIWAHYEPLQYTVTFRTDGGTGTGTVDQASRPWPYGEKFTVTATPTNGSEFVKWSDGNVSNPREITVTAPAVYTAVFDLICYDVTFNWKTGDNVATQETQRVVWGTAATPPVDTVVNSKIGYSWTGWDVSSDAFLSVKSNMTVHAAYAPNQYTVRYVADGQQGDVKDSQTFFYDKPDKLRSGSGLESAEGWRFWSWECNGVTYAAVETVSNLTAEADGVVTMKAVWDVGDLSRAMKCDNLYWKESSDPGWKPGQEAAVWESAENDEYMFATVQTNGVLSFDWKVEGPLDDQMEMYLFYYSNSDHALWRGTVANNEWHHEEVSVPLRQESDSNYGFPLEVRLGLYVPNAQVTAYIRNVTWIPAGSSVDPTEKDAVKISSAEVSGNKFKLSFTSDEQFGYNLLTNANLLIDSWGVKEYRPGGGTITLEPEIESGVPQMFYKVETIRKK